MSRGLLLCLNASSSPPRLDILKRTGADLQQDWGGGGKAQAWLHVRLTGAGGISTTDRLLTHPQLLTAMMLDTRTNGYVRMLAKNCKKASLGWVTQEFSSHRELFCLVVVLFTDSPLSQPGSSSWFHWCDSSAKNKNRVSVLIPARSAQRTWEHVPSHRWRMCWWNEPARYKSTERRRPPGDEGSDLWRKVDKTLIN